VLSRFSLFLFLLVLAWPWAIFAHRLDEFLQATLVTIEPDRVRLQINLTPGVAVAEKVLGLVDRNRDGAISTNEAAAYCELLKHDLSVKLDQRDLKLKCTASYFPGLAELRTGWGFIQIEFLMTTEQLAAGAHSLSIENRHLPKLSVYLINATRPASGSIRITKQTRNENQSTGEIQFTVDSPRNSS
jgi:hypothetical protein